MRIAIDCTAGFQQWAGIGRYTRGLVRALAALDRANDYVLFHFRGARNNTDNWITPTPNFQDKPISFSERTVGMIWYHLGIPLPVDFFVGSADLYHSPDFVLPPVRRGRAVVTVHDLSFMLFPECAEEGLRRYLDRMVPHSLSRADLVLADSANTQNDLICLLDVPPEKVEVVYPAAEPHFRRVEDPPVLSKVRQKYKVPDSFILSVGTLEPRKNLVRLVKAYRRLKRESAFTPKLLISGREGWLFQDIYKAVADAGLEDDVKFVGYVAEEDLPALYSMAEALVFPSLYEGFGFPPLEAMACGTPVVCSTRSSLPEVVGEAAVLVDPHDVPALADAIHSVIDSPDLRARLVQKGLVQAQKFSWEKTAEKVLGLYSRLLERS